MAISPKVSASTVGAATATVITSVIANHLFHGDVPSDVLGLIEATLTAGVTFAFGYMARHVPAPVVHEIETAVKDAATPAGA